MSTKPTIQQLAIPGLNLNARVWGSSSGVPVLGMHGWLDNAATFDLIAPFLPDLHLVSVDFPGHGYSDYLPACATYNNIDRALQMLQVVDQLGWQEFSIIGHSLGGIVGQIMAAIEPTRIKKIVLIDVLGAPPYSGNAFVSRIRNYQEASKHTLQHAIYTSIEHAAIKRSTSGITGKISLAAARVLAAGGLMKVSEGYIWTYDTRLQLPSVISMTNEQTKAILSELTTDCMLIAGNEGILPQYGIHDHHIESLQNVKYYKLPGGHHLHLDTPGPVAKKLADFFR